VLTCITGRSPRTQRLVDAAGVKTVPTLDELVQTCDLLVSVVPPDQAELAADSVADATGRTRSSPLYADLNAVSPSTVGRIAGTLTSAGLDLVDGSISGPPPRAGADPTRVYVCGEQSGRFLALSSPWLTVTWLDGPIGSASALKMCTASMYKGTNALIMQALLTADRFGVRAEFLADTAEAWPADVPGWPRDVAVAATKAWRYVGEMHEIAATQRAAGLPGELFDGVAATYTRAAQTQLGQTEPEDISRAIPVEEVIAGLGLTAARRPRPEQ
jgi:3-hydroxyisobutyrate dehydrogenase-like beta-hydroxyacid dehydrogenase